MEQKELYKENSVYNISFESSETSNIVYNKDSKKESEILKLFCSDINKINEKDECNWTPLYRSVIAGNLKATEVLLKNGANPNIQCSMGETSLYQAVDMEKTDHVKLLLKRGADPNICQIDGLSSLHLAVSKQNIIIIKYLLKYNANPNKQSTLYKQTPVHLAIKNNVDSMILLILVNCGGSLTIKDKFGKKPIDYINSEEMRKTVEMLKLDKNNDNIHFKKIYYTPSKRNKLTINNVISKTIKSQSPKQKDINQSNIVTLKNSSKSKINFIELNPLNSNKNIEIINIYEDNGGNDIENINNNLKINLFEPREQKNKKSILTYKKAKYFYKNPKFVSIHNKLLNNTNIYKNIYSPIKEESSDNFSSNKCFKKISENAQNQKYKYRYSLSSFSKSNNKTEFKNSKNSNSQSDLNKKYLRKKTTDKISAFKCESNKNNLKIKTNNNNNIYQINNIKKIMNKSSNIKNISNSRNMNNIFLDNSSNKNENLLITNIIGDTLANYKTNFTTKSNKVLKERNSSLNSMKEYNTNNNSNSNLSIKTYNKPKVTINSYKNLKDKNIFVENTFKSKLIKKKNRNFFNSKNNTLRNQLNKKGMSLISQEQIPVSFLNNNKENLSNNIKLSLLSSSTRNSNYGKNSYFRNSHNSSISQLTYYTYSKNENNSLLEVVEKNFTNKNIVNKKETLPIYKWLKEIDLLCYLPLFIKKKIFSFQKIISDLKSKKIVIIPDNIKKIGIETPGHIYRIFIKLEIDAELIDRRVYDYLLFLKKEEEKIKEMNDQKENEESINSIYDCSGCGGCCSLKKSNLKFKIEKPPLEENKLYIDLEKWLENINMIKYKQNFIEYGFDKIEFFILQMFSSIPLEEKIFEKEMHIDNNNDIDLFILQLNKDIKLISHKIRKKRSSSVEVEKKISTKCLLSKESEPKKRITRAVSNSNCSIF